MDDLSKKTVLVYDLGGSFTHIADALVPDFGRVLYHTNWETGFATVSDYLPGAGLPGIERVMDPADHFDDCDLVVFPDVGLGGLQEYLRSQGIPVWGSGRHERLERDRIYLKETLMGLGMDVPEFQVITGLPLLREFLDRNEHAWIKISYFRGVSETKEHEYGFASQGWADDLAVKLGPLQNQLPFLVEQPIEGDAVEVGIDVHAINGILPERMFWGYEAKDTAFLGTTSRVPERLLKVSLRFQHALEGYCGPLSTEVRTTEDHDFIVDFTARFPSPPSEIQVKNIKNLARLMYDGARGIPCRAEYLFPVAAQLVLTSQVLEDHALGIQIGMPERVAVHGLCNFQGKNYAASPLKIAEFAGAVGLSDTIMEAIEEATEAAKSVIGDCIKFDAKCFSDVLDTIEAGEKLGLTWGVPNEVAEA